MKHLSRLFVFLLLASWPALSQAATIEADICIYGGTSGGVVAAVQAARMGKRAIIVEPGKHLGGMMAGGLSWSDVGSADRAKLFGGLAREVFERIGKHYGQDPKTVFDVTSPEVPGRAKSGVDFIRPPSLAFEPKVAEQVFTQLAREAGVAVQLSARLKSVLKQGPRLTQLVLEDGRVVTARMFVDATYEGDLMAAAGVSYTLGREANDQYGEKGNGVRGPLHGPTSGRFIAPVDPYVTAGDPDSGFLPLIAGDSPEPLGSADKHIQSYNYRLCLTDDPALRVPLDPPAGYDPAHWELLGRYIVALTGMGEKLTLRSFCKYDPLPNHKFDFNNRWPISTDLLGGADGWPEGSASERAKIAKAHEDYLRGFFHFLRNDRRVPENVREEASRFGLPCDEFLDNGHWPHQLYVREARRMVSDLVMTEHHIRNERIELNPVALATYPMDIHAVRRVFQDGKLYNEGFGEGGGKPAPVGYGAIVPKAGECENLFVTFALSSSHAAFGSIRMEPVFMVTSQSAATAAALAIDDGVPVQAVDYTKLKQCLLANGQVLETTDPEAAQTPKTSAVRSTRLLRILPLGDSITRGSYLAKIDGKSTGLPHPEGGGWRKPLQDKLRAAGIAYDFVGDLSYAAYGRDGLIDPQFDPDHHGLAGFSNRSILQGGVVPTLPDVLESLGVKQVSVPGIVEVLNKHKPDVILLMSGANGFDAPARNVLIRTIGEVSGAHLFVATILPQTAPRAGWENVGPYNASLPAVSAAQKAAGKHITLVDMHAAILVEDLLPDGVHPTAAGMQKIADVWFDALSKSVELSERRLPADSTETNIR
jgi:hypothetical protein